jgi:hypothetical protein
MVKRILMIAYHFPPFHGSSGMQRTLRFSQYLPEFNWQPIVLSAHPRAYQSIDYTLSDELSDQIPVYRAFALDTSRHLSFMNRYSQLLALPDRWVTWWLGAVPVGLYLIKKYKPDVIWSTYPIATAHLIGFTLYKITNTPWVADFRDPMVQIDYPSNPLTYRAYQWIENKTISHCTCAVFTTPGTRDDYISRFPSIPESRFRLIENGYDEQSFASAATFIGNKSRAKAQERIVLLHSGVIYPSERDPTIFFDALSDLLRQGLITSNTLKIIFRATYHDRYLQRLIDEYGIGTIVSLAPPIAYQEALSEMLTADGLLLIQAANCNNQIPAKLYEYLRAQRPILALTDPTGDTARKLKEMGSESIARLDSKADISHELLLFMAKIRENKIPSIPLKKVYSHSRKARTKELAILLKEIAG